MVTPNDGHWRKVAAPIIAQAIAQYAKPDVPHPKNRELRKALRDAYPFKYRRNWPYKVWCNEVKIQLGIIKLRPTCQPKHEPAPGQKDLFE